MIYLIKGILTGLLFGIPVGAVGTMTIQRTLKIGRKGGYLTGLGSSAADCLYAAAGAFGLHTFSEFLFTYEKPIQLTGGILLLLMGFKTMLCPKTDVKKQNSVMQLPCMLLSSLVIGITNPAAIVTFLLAFPTLDFPVIWGIQTPRFWFSVFLWEPFSGG